MYNAVINPIAKVLGYILDILFRGLDVIGIGNIAIAIVIFTIIVKLCMMPLTFKQMKMTKSLIHLLVQRLKRFRRNTKEKQVTQIWHQRCRLRQRLYMKKYGVSQMGGCIQLLIQFPILMALYGVFQRIPIYIESVKVYFTNFSWTRYRRNHGPA